MAPWPQRQNSNPTPSSTQAAPSPQDLNRPLPPPPFNHAASYEIPTLRRKPPATDGAASILHSRSFSHPFPSLFGGKKADKKPTLRGEENIFDTTDDDASIHDGRSNGAVQSPSRKVSQKGSKEPVTGKCMTCDSTVRWPQGLKVFRCTICLTINDLEPYSENRNGIDGRSGFGSAAAHRKPLALSLDRTRSIIDHCLSQHFETYLSDKPTPPKQQGSPPPSPLFDSSFPSEGIMYSQMGDGDKQPPQASPLKRSEVGRQASSPRPRLTTRSPSDPSMSPATFHDNSANSLRPPLPHESTPQRPLTAVAPSSERPSFALTDPLVSEDEVASKQSKASAAMFRPLESYIAGCFTGCATLNTSFLTFRSQHQPADLVQSAENLDKVRVERRLATDSDGDGALSEPDAKTLLLGDVAENGMWWTGNRMNQGRPDKEHKRPRSPESLKGIVSLKTPRVDWTELAEWYRVITQAGSQWKEKWREMCPHGNDTDSIARRARWEASPLDRIDRDIGESRIHAQRALLKSTETLLKRPRRPLKRAEDCRFLFILLANPLLSSAYAPAVSVTALRPERVACQPSQQTPRHAGQSSPSKRQLSGSQRSSGGPGQHSGIIKRILGLMANSPNEVHQYFVSWLSRGSDNFLQRTVELVGSFVTHRLSRQHNRKRSELVNPTDGLVPSFSDDGVHHPSQLHAALGGRPSSTSKSTDGKPKLSAYGDDWQVRAAARVMALLFAANTGHPAKKRETIPYNQRMQSARLNAKHQAHAHGQVVPISNFYNMMLDYADLVADFEAWEANRGKFSFCQYPFFLSIWAKIHILEHDARRQMEVKAREAFFDSILSRKAVSQFLVLKVRRDCLVEDSLRGVSEVVGTGGEEIKKGLRIDFVGEEGVDAGGLRKEWFLLLVREIFDPHHGLFVYDDDSNFCYFNPFCFESSEQFFLVGVLLGLAIYNSTILDVAFPPFVFKKVLASAPTTNVPAISTPRLNHGYTLEDLAEYRPVLAKGLRQLLDFEGNVQETFCRDFVAEVERYGEVVQVPLCSNGENRPVTNTNRREFVDLYIQYQLDTAVTRQYEPFKRGFFTVCGGNALSLFRPEEIELLVRGSDEPLDIGSLRAVASYDGLPNHNKDPEKQPQVMWFWDFFERATTADQRKILSFITGSDRIPAMGATNLVIKIVLLMAKPGSVADTHRFPSARTCFNTLYLYPYPSRRVLEEKLWTAVNGSEGFGLK